MRRAKRLIAVAGVMLITGLPGVAVADTFEDAVAAYKAGQTAEAARTFITLAELGNAAANFNLAFLYLRGEGVPQSDRQAYYWSWMARLGNVNSAKAMVALLEDRLTDKTRKQVATRLRTDLIAQIDAGNDWAMPRLARAYLEPADGRPADQASALIWLTVATALGQDNVAGARDVLAGAMAPKERTAAQDKAAVIFTDWCSGAGVSHPSCRTNVSESG